MDIRAVCVMHLLFQARMEYDTLTELGIKDTPVTTVQLFVLLQASRLSMHLNSIKNLDFKANEPHHRHLQIRPCHLLQPFSEKVISATACPGNPFP